MNEYISRGAVLDHIKEAQCQKCSDIGLCGNCAVLTAVRLVESVPAADVVEVVRCRDCIFWDTSWNPGIGMTGEAYYCSRCHLVTLKDSFCSGAFQKDGGQDE